MPYTDTSMSSVSATESSIAPRRDSSENTRAIRPSTMSLSSAGISTQVNAVSRPCEGQREQHRHRERAAPLSTFGRCRSQAGVGGRPWTVHGR